MAVFDDIKKVVEGVDNIATDGVPINIKHELDAPTVSYFALMAFLVVVGAVVLIGFKDYVVSKVTS
jgi:hypothetical protein